MSPSAVGTMAWRVFIISALLIRLQIEDVRGTGNVRSRPSSGTRKARVSGDRAADTSYRGLLFSPVSALSEYGYGVVAVEVLAVPFRGSGIIGDVGVLGVDWV